MHFIKGLLFCKMSSAFNITVLLGWFVPCDVINMAKACTFSFQMLHQYLKEVVNTVLNLQHVQLELLRIASRQHEQDPEDAKKTSVFFYLHPFFSLFSFIC